MVDRTLKTTLDADVGKFVNNFQEAAVAARELGDQMERAGKLADRLDRVARSSDKVKKSIPDGRQLHGFNAEMEKIDRASGGLDRTANGLLGIGVGAAAGLTLLGKAALDWESQWAGVEKTVDGNIQQMDSLEDSLRGLARTMPATHEEIAGVAEAAGQLGVGIGSMTDFTRVMINLGETTNLTAEDAATSLAQLMNIMGTAPDNVDRLGATIVDLGNKGASTEKQILEMGQRIAGAGNQVGLAETDVLAFASAVTSTGIEVEAGGTAISTSLLKINDAVRAGGADLDTIAQTAGVSSAEFARAWGEDAAGAMLMFVEGLDEAHQSGVNTNSILKALGITGQREKDAMLRLAGAGGLLADSLSTANTAWEQNLALAEEAAKRYSTTEAQVQIAMNTMRDEAIDAGEVLLPMVADIATGFSDLATAAGQIPEPIQEFGVQAAVFVGASALIGGAGIKAVTGLAGLVTSFRTVQVEAPKAARGMQLAGKAVGVLSAVLIAANIGRMIEEQMGARPRTTIEQFNQAIAGLAGDSPTALQDLDALFNNKGGSFFTADLETTNITNLNDAMDRLFNKDWRQTANDFVAGPIGALTGLGSTVGDIEDRLKQFDQSLQFMSSSGAGDAAAESFAQIAKTMLDQGASIDEVVARFPQYRDEVSRVARETHGLNLTNAELFEWMQGKLPPGLERTTDAARRLEKVQQDLTITEETLTGKQQQFNTAISESVDQFSALNDAVLSAEKSKNSFERALLTLNDALSDETNKLKASKDASDETKLGVLDNRDAVTDLVGSLNEQITTQFQATAKTGDFTKAQKDASEALRKGREKILDSAEAAGLNREAVAKMIDKMLLTPEELETKVNAPGLTDLQKEIENLKKQIKELKDKELKITTEFEIKGFNAVEMQNGEVIWKQGNKTIGPGGQSGGFIAGGYTGNLDPRAVAGVVHGDEHVTRSPSRRKLEAAKPGALDYMNETGQWPGFYDGGRVPLIGGGTGMQRGGAVKRKIDYRSITDGVDFDIHAPIDSVTEAVWDYQRAQAKEISKAIKDALATGGAYSHIDISNPTGRTTFRGHTFSNQAAATLAATERDAGRAFVIFQGGYRPETSYSGTSHQGDAIDARVDQALMRSGIKFGLKLWDRTGKGNWASHMHGIFGPGAGYGAGSAVWQWQDYLRGGDGLAAGGPVRGPGGPTDDRVPIWASNGEYMLPAKAAEVIGPALLERLRRLGGPMAGMAAGGPIAPSEFGRSNAFDISVIVKLIREIEKPTSELAKATKEIAASRREQVKATAEQKRLREDLRDTKPGSKARDRAQDAYDRAEERARAAADRLSTAQDELARQQEAVAQSAQQVSDQFRDMYQVQSTDARDWITRMKDGAKEIDTFREQIAGLRARGLNETVIEQIIAMGVQAGGELTQSVRGKGAITELNRASQALQDAADRFGYGSATAPLRKASGGLVWGPGTPISDSIDVKASRGEYLVNAYATAAHFEDLQRINYGYPVRRSYVANGYAGGGMIDGGSMIDRQALADAVRQGMSGLRMSATINGRTVEMIVEGALSAYTDEMGRSRR